MALEYQKLTPHQTALAIESKLESTRRGGRDCVVDADVDERPRDERTS